MAECEPDPTTREFFEALSLTIRHFVPPTALELFVDDLERYVPRRNSDLSEEQRQRVESWLEFLRQKVRDQTVNDFP